MRFLKSSSFFLLIILAVWSCKAPYKNLQAAPVNVSALSYKPQFDKALYRCVVDGRVLFKKFHLSGILFFKTMENGTVRAVFQNEMGFSFFDFEWDGKDSFHVNQVIEQLDRPAVIKTLQKDLSLLLMKGLDTATERVFVEDSMQYHRFTLDKGYAYYITKSGELKRIENAGERKKVIGMAIGTKTDRVAMPESIFIDHYKANFTIQLTKLPSDANE